MTAPGLVYLREHRGRKPTKRLGLCNHCRDFIHRFPYRCPWCGWRNRPPRLVQRWLFPDPQPKRGAP